jgi:hypothetical protein
VFQVTRVFGMVRPISLLNSLFSRMFQAISEKTNLFLKAKRLDEEFSPS